MRVEDDVWVTVRYRLYDAQGEEVEPGERELTYMQGGYGAVFDEIERALEGHEVGFATSVHLEPEDSFGDYDPQLVRLVPRARFPEQLEVGMTFEGVPGEEDEDEDDLYIVTDFTEEAVVLDGNHPLAGMALRFDIEVVDLRAASDEEVAVERAGGHAIDDDEFDQGGPSGADDPDEASPAGGRRAARDPRRLH